MNSLTVTQNSQPNGGTAQTRTYYYDMLGRLTYESNPETKINQYFYDNLTSDAKCGTVSSPGDLVKTVDNIGKIACLTYDGLHRVLSITYYGSPATPTKMFVYESAIVNGTTMGLTAGRLAEAYTCTGSCTTKLTDIGFSYSARGELMDVYESTPHSGGYYHVSANYWSHGLLSSLTLVGTTLPTIYYGASDGSGLDGEGRVTKVTASSGTALLANNVIYTASGSAQPIGSLTSVTLGSGDSDAFGYDTLTGRLTSYTFNMNSAVAKSGALTWNANGSLGTLALTDNVTPANSQTCSYSHDDLGRISSANCSVNKWSQTFSYDPFGNIKKTATVGTNFLPTYDLSTNRYNTVPTCTRSYDGDGNLTNDCSHTYTWRVDGAVATVDTVALTYDALGRAVEQAQGTSYTQIVYTPGGGKLALMNGTTVQKGFIPLPGGGTAVYTTASGVTNVAYYRHADWLGSSRLTTTPTAPTTVYADTEYAPYGEAYGVTGTLDLNFTGQNQDAVPSSNSGLYDFLFREYNPQHGRWISPDPAGKSAVNLAAPQTWNRYAYVANGPLNSADPLGLFRSWDQYYMGGNFDNSCSINGAAANCGMANDLLSEGGGGAAALNCTDNCDAFISGALRIGANDEVVTPNGQGFATGDDDQTATASDFQLVAFGGGGKLPCSRNQTISLAPSKSTKLATGLYLTSVTRTADFKAAGFTISAALGSNLGNTGLFLPAGSDLKVMGAPGGFNMSVVGAESLGYLMLPTPINTGVNSLSVRNGSFTNVHGERPAHADLPPGKPEWLQSRRCRCRRTGP